MQSSKRVFKYKLDNGLTLLVCPKKLAPKVSLQLWYNVGSKHEVAGEKGMAHFIEHMIFKGTHSMLSEPDINLVTQKLSAYANAFTSYDYTGYLFDVPVANWDKVLPIFADCMQNCSFEQDHLNSEVKAVIQELKMYRDDFTWTLADSLVTAIFESHPYHYPIIGYKQDLWNLQRQTLINFYKKYYVPQNAALVITGDVDPEEVHKKVLTHFAAIPRGADTIRPEFFINEELQAKSITIYRDTQQATCMLAFVVPGATEKKEFLYDIVAYLLCNGKGSRLHKILVDEKALVVSIHAMSYDLFDREIFFIEFKPKKESDIALIKEIILREIQDLTQKIPQAQLRRALKLAEVDYQLLLEDAHKQAYAIGKAFTAMQDENYPFNYCNYDEQQLPKDLQNLLQKYFKAALCHEGKIVKIAPEDQEYLNQLQEESDKLDTKILFGKERTSPVQDGCFVNTFEVEKLSQLRTLQPEIYTLKNGLTVALHLNDQVNLVECVLQYKADHYYDPAQQEGVSYLVAKLMLEGTVSYPGRLFIDEVESYGISISSTPGQIAATMLSVDAQKGISFISDMVQNAQLTQKDFDRVCNKTKLLLTQFWDTPNKCMAQVAAQKIYGKHPYGYMTLGTQDSLDKMTQAQCLSFYKNMISPQQATLVVVGNFDKTKIVQDIENLIGNWTGSKIQDIAWPLIASVKGETVSIEKNRDQVVLAFAGLSVERMNPEYDALLVYDQILACGMSSRLFDLREQSGLFYTIGGSLVYGAGKQPGMIFIKTIVSKDRLQEAQDAILNCLDSAIDTVTEKEFDEAKEVVINNFPTLFESNGAIATTLLFLQKYNLPVDYFSSRMHAIRTLKLSDMKNIVKKHLNRNKLITIRIGRI